MTQLAACSRISKSLGHKNLFENLDLGVAEEERLGIIGANGAGKSTLLRLLAGLETPDAGECTRRRDLRIGFVEQDPRFAPGRSVSELVAEGSRLLHPHETDEERSVRVAAILSRLDFPDPDQRVETLSGGWHKRVAIARALVDEPELLLLDEPTNHLDLEGILWLEKLLLRARFAFVLVTHDRALLQAVARRVAEVDPRYPGGLFLAEGDYARFLEAREDFLEARSQREQALANRVRREVAWLRRGPKARSTKAQGRIDQAKAWISELEDLRARRPGDAADVELAATGRRTRKLVRLEGVSKRMGDRPLFSGVDLLLGPGSRLGLVGPNGSGKTTLLKLLAGEIPPDTGSVEWAERLDMAVFEQRRTWVDPEQSLRRALAPDGDSVLYRGVAEHVVTWARRFGFEARQLDTPVGRLSGGEQARIAIARLMLLPADLLLLDEPTNDLDIPTLEALEESLLDFPGAVVLVTHDRYLMDRVAERLLGLDGRGNATFVADVDQWATLVREAALQKSTARRLAPEGPKVSDKDTLPRRPAGLTSKERQELADMEGTILEAEERLTTARAAFEDPSIATNAPLLVERQRELEAAEERVSWLYERWAELDARRRAKAAAQA